MPMHPVRKQRLQIVLFILVAAAAAGRGWGGPRGGEVWRGQRLKTSQGFVRRRGSLDQTFGDLFMEKPK